MDFGKLADKLIVLADKSEATKEQTPILVSISVTPQQARDLAGVLRDEIERVPPQDLTFYDYQIAAYVDGIEAISESVVIRWRKQLTSAQAKSRLAGVDYFGLLPDNVSHVQIRDAEGQAISEVWSVE